MPEERVVPLPGSPEWEPNVPDAVLVAADGTAVLALSPHLDDADRRAVLFVWHGCLAVTSGAPNDEARHLHRLHDRGLEALGWAGEVLDSTWAAAVLPMAARPVVRHFVVPHKEGLVEVLAADVEVVRVAGGTVRAAAAWVRR